MDIDKKDFLFEDIIHPFLFDGVKQEYIELFKKLIDIQKMQSRIISLVAKKYGIYHSQLFCLKVIHSIPYISQSDLAKKLNLNRATITTNVKKLEKIKLIKRNIDENDQRTFRITLTKKGKEIVEMANKIMAEQLNQWYSDLDKKEANQMILHVDKLLYKLEECHNTMLKEVGKIDETI